MLFDVVFVVVQAMRSRASFVFCLLTAVKALPSVLASIWSWSAANATCGRTRAPGCSQVYPVALDSQNIWLCVVCVTGIGFPSNSPARSAKEDDALMKIDSERVCKQRRRRLNPWRSPSGISFASQPRDLQDATVCSHTHRRAAHSHTRQHTRHVGR